MNKLNQKGFAITSFLYSIFLLIIIFLILILLLIGNSSINYFRIQKQVKDKLDEITYSTGGINNYAIITFEKENLIIKKGESIDLLEDVKVIRYDGEEINNSIIYTSKPIFDNNKVGKYVIYYEATVDGRLIKKNRVITVKEQTFNQEGIYITDVQIENKENSNIVYSKNVLTSAITFPEQENIITITFYNHTNNNYGLLDVIKKEYSNENVTFEIMDIGNILVSKEYTTIRLKFSCLDNTVEKTLKSILEFQFEEIPYVIASYNYTGKEEKFVVPYEGVYKLEVWGAQGGSYNDTSCIGGYGGYSKGNVLLTKNQEIFIVVGGKGTGNATHAYNEGGYNGGGDATPDTDENTRQSSGGGATHIALTNRGILEKYENYVSDILIVAGGGGGSAGNAAIMCVTSGSGGGMNGGDGTKYVEYDSSAIGYGATQTSGGTYLGDFAHLNVAGTFGKGASGTYSGGGGGLYGGGVSHSSSGGGSGYISNPLLNNKYMACYNCTPSNKEDTKTISALNVSESPLMDNAKIGNGYAKITFLGNN